MAHAVVAHFANDLGVKEIHVGLKEFMCMGARSPFDHPHVFLDMGKENSTICPYCSTHFVYDSSLKANQSRPQEAFVGH